MSSSRSPRRLAELDGFRALAILLVILFHYFQRFPEFYPYGESILPPARYGYLGVELFFIISGFVIALSLRGSASIRDFAWKRLLRLWPAMLVCSVITFIIMHWIVTPFTDEERIGFSGFLPSLTFTTPIVWSRLFPDLEFKYIDGAYWSLFVEVRFYFWAAVLTAVLGIEKFARNALVFFGLAFFMFHLAKALNLPLAPGLLELLFFPQYLPLFCAGILFSEIWNGNDRPAIWVAIMGLLAVVPVSAQDMTAAVITGLWFVLFVLLVKRPQWLGIFKSRPAVWIGLISYPLYLLHQDIGVALMTLLPSGWSPMGYVTVALVVGLAVVLLAAVIHYWVEKPVQSAARERLTHATRRLPS